MIGLHLNLPERPRVLCVGAHCDDIEIGCGGTVMHLLASHPGLEVTWAVMASTPEREREARAAAEDLLGSASRRIVIRDFRDGYLPLAAGEIKSVLHELREEARPHLVLCHHRGDLHQDHRLLGELVWQTFREHLILEYEIPKYDGDLGRPNFYVPLAEPLVERKVAVILRHFRSQAGKAWFSADTFRALLRLRGVEAGVTWAEAFHVAKAVLD